MIEECLIEHAFGKVAEGKFHIACLIGFKDFVGERQVSGFCPLLGVAVVAVEEALHRRLTGRTLGAVREECVHGGRRVVDHTKRHAVHLCGA